MKTTCNRKWAAQKAATHTPILTSLIWRSIACAVIFLATGILSAQDYLYFTVRDGNRLMRCKTDGTFPETVLQGNQSETVESAIAFDMANGHLYSGTSKYLYRANLDLSDRVNLAVTTGLVQDVELDLVHRRIYWGESAGGGGGTPIRLIFSAKLDGSDKHLLRDISTSHGFLPGIAVDPYRGKVYITHVADPSSIEVMNLDGTDSRTLYEFPPPIYGQIGDIEIDPASGTLYFNFNAGPGGVYKAPATGTGPVDLVAPPPAGKSNGGMCHYDAVGGMVYQVAFSQQNMYSIVSSLKDGSNPVEVAAGYNIIMFMETAHAAPLLNLHKAIKPSFSNLWVGSNYQLQLSGDMNTWTNHGSPFTATNASMVYPQYWDVDNWGSLFFRVKSNP